MTATPEPPGLPAEDEKLLALARSARARSRAAEAAAVRDDAGRTYVASSVALPSLRLSAVQAVVAAAVSSGCDRLEAAVLVGDHDGLAAADRAVLDDMSVTTVLLAGAEGPARAG